MNKWAKRMASLEILDETGNRYGRLVVTGPDFVSDKHELWTCACDCGQKIKAWGQDLRDGAHTTCGCKLPADRTRDPNYSYYSLPGGTSSFNSIYRSYRDNAKRRDFPFDLTKEAFLVLTSSPCHYCGEFPSKVDRRGHPDKESFYLHNGIDRKNNSLGYSIDNCVPACRSCNMAKHARPYDDFISWIDRLIANRHNLEKDRSSPSE